MKILKTVSVIFLIAAAAYADTDMVFFTLLLSTVRFFRNWIIKPIRLT